MTEFSRRDIWQRYRSIARELGCIPARVWSRRSVGSTWCVCQDLLQCRWLDTPIPQRNQRICPLKEGFMFRNLQPVQAESGPITRSPANLIPDIRICPATKRPQAWLPVCLAPLLLSVAAQARATHRPSWPTYFQPVSSAWSRPLVGLATAGHGCRLPKCFC